MKKNIHKTGLVALDFKDDIKRLTIDFTGREWLMEEVDSWLSQTEERFFVLTGEPGSGKSAFTARLIQKRKDIAAYNFCMAGRNDTIVPNTVLRSLGAQLGRTIPDYSKALVNTIKPEKISLNVRISVDKMTEGEIAGVIIGHLHASEPKEVMEIILRAPLSILSSPANPYIILIDSLDEAVNYNRDVNLVTLLSSLNDLPPWVRFLCTSRPARSVLSYFNKLTRHFLEAESKMNLEDVAQYVSGRLSMGPLQTRIKTTSGKPGDVINKLRDNNFHKGNFLFSKVVLDDIETGRQSIEDINKLPESLDDIYHGFLRRIKGPWHELYQPVLNILSVIREPASELQLANYTGIKRSAIHQSLGTIIQFLDEQENDLAQKTYSIYHQSFRDYLLDEDRNEDFWCAPIDGHQGICQYYLEKCNNQWSECDKYGLLYLPEHLSKSGRYQDLHNLYLNYCWLQSRLNTTDIYVLMADLWYLPEDEIIQLLGRSLHQSAYILARDKTQLTGQLLGRLLDEPTPEIQNLLKQAQHSQSEPWLRPLSNCFMLSGRGELFKLGDNTLPASVVPPDGKSVITIGSNSELRMWNVSNGQPIYPFLYGHTQKPDILRISPDGKDAVSASQDGTICRWNLKDLELSRKYAIPENFICRGLTPDTSKAILFDQNGLNKRSPLIWDLNLNDYIPLQGFVATNSTQDILFTSDSTRLLITNNMREQYIDLWDINTGLKLFTFNAWDIRGISPDNNYLASGDSLTNQTNLKIWNLKTGELLYKLVGHNHIPYHVQFLQYDTTNQIVSGDLESRIIFWDLLSGKQQLIIDCDTRKVRNIDNSLRDGNIPLFDRLQQPVQEWWYELGRRIRRQEGGFSLNALLATPNGKRLATLVSPVHYERFFGSSRVRGSLSHDRKILFLWDLHQQKVESVWRFSDSYDSLNTKSTEKIGLAFALQEKRILTFGERLNVFGTDLYATSSGHHFSHRECVSTAAVATDCLTGVTGSEDGTIAVWDLTTGKIRYRLEAHSEEEQKGIVGVALSPDNQRLVSSGHRTIKVWNLITGKLTGRLKDHKQLGGYVAVTNGYPHIITASMDNSIRVWNLQPNGVFGKVFKMIWYFHQLSYDSIFSRNVMTINHSIDGSLIVANPYRAGFQPIQVWDVKNNLMSAIIPGDYLEKQTSPQVDGAAITSENSQVITVSKSGIYQVWDLKTENLFLTRGCKNTGKVEAIAISQDGSCIAFSFCLDSKSANDPGVVEIWNSKEDVSYTIKTSGTVFKMKITSNGRYGAFLCQGQTIEIWELIHGKQIGSFTTNEILSECALAPNASTVIAGDVSGNVYLFRIDNIEKTDI